MAREDFSNPAKHRFGTTGSTAATSTVTGGAYRMVLLKAGVPYGQMADVGAAADTVSIAMDLASSATAAAAWKGPLCFFQQGFGFSLRLYGDGRYELVQISMQGAVEGTLASGSTTPPSAGESTRMRLDCTWDLNDATATGWVDSAQVGPAPDVEPSDNILRKWAAEGFWAMSPTVPATIVVDNVVMTEAAS